MIGTDSIFLISNFKSLLIAVLLQLLKIGDTYLLAEKVPFYVISPVLKIIYDKPWDFLLLGLKGFS